MFLEFIQRILFITPNIPKTVQVSISNKCNFDCKMCPTDELGVLKEVMDFEFFKAIMEKVCVKGVKNLNLAGWGEPMMNKDILKMIKYGKDHGLSVRFTSNGSLLNDKMIDGLIENGLNAINFSVDEIEPDEESMGHPILNQLNNIVNFKRAINERGSNIKIYMLSTYHKGKEKGILDVVDYTIENELDGVTISRLNDNYQDTPRPTLAEELKLIKMIECKIKGTKTILTFYPYVALGGIKRIIYKLTYPMLHRFRKYYCLRTFDDVYINIQGKVTPCCALPYVELGDITKDSLEDIWLNGKYQSFLVNQKKYCKKCDVLSLKPHQQ